MGGRVVGTWGTSQRALLAGRGAGPDGRTRRWRVPTRPSGAGGSQVHAAPRASARAVPCRALRAGACVTGKGCRGLRRGGVVRETSRSRSQFNAAAGSRMRRLSLPGGRTARARAEVLAGSVLWSPALDRGAGDGGVFWMERGCGHVRRTETRRARGSGLHGRLATGADRLVRRVRFVAAKVWFAAAGPCYRLFRSPSVTRRATLSAGLWTANSSMAVRLFFPIHQKSKQTAVDGDGDVNGSCCLLPAGDEVLPPAWRETGGRCWLRCGAVRCVRDRHGNGRLLQLGPLGLDRVNHLTSTH